MKTIEIPYYKTLILEHVVLDYNGTIAKDGELKVEVKALLLKLCENYTVHVITADTFGSVKAQMEGFDVVVKVLQTYNHTAEKAAYVDVLGKENCVAVGNGNNDAHMLENAILGIAIVGDEGCASPTLLQSDIICKEIADALALLLNEKRLIATLRK
ncbi:MAG: haloacid dehalogenase [Epsilonproteobacteria bacterium]|nr:haloacid dehalogenase [Campylobacterota bacterium]